MGTFLSALKTMGLRESDPRLKEMMDNLIKQIKQKVGDDFHIDSHEVNFEQFKRYGAASALLLVRKCFFVVSLLRTLGLYRARFDKSL